MGGNPDVTPFLQCKISPPDPNEEGWKDTAIMYPGQVTRIAVRFAPPDGRLTGQIGAGLRQPFRHDLERRIAFQRMSVIGVFVAQRDGEYALPKKGDAIMERALPISAVLNAGCS